jgi:hypothetical protein
VLLIVSEWHAFVGDCAAIAIHDCYETPISCQYKHSECSQTQEIAILKYTSELPLLLLLLLPFVAATAAAAAASALPTQKPLQRFKRYKTAALYSEKALRTQACESALLPAAAVAAGHSAAAAVYQVLYS